jgi:hypothetical protein
MIVVVCAAIVIALCIAVPGLTTRARVCENVYREYEAGSNTDVEITIAPKMPCRIEGVSIMSSTDGGNLDVLEATYRIGGSASLPVAIGEASMNSTVICAIPIYTRPILGIDDTVVLIYPNSGSANWVACVTWSAVQ